MVGIDYYREVWHGSYDGADLNVLISRAELIVSCAISDSGYTLNTIPTGLQENVKSAICAQIDHIGSCGGSEAISENAIASASLGGYSYSLADGGKATSAADLCSLSLRLLRTSGLLYKGVSIL